MTKIVALHKQKLNYSLYPPFNPSRHHPELSHFPETADNQVYDSLRSLFVLLGYDVENYGTSHWDPLGWLIKPGNTVFIKPNMIAEKHKLSDDWDYLITHGSVIRACLDYVFIAMKGRGRVMIGDAPQTDSKFNKIVELMGLKEIRDVYKNDTEFEIEILNLQDEHWIERDGIYIETVKLPGDPRGGVCVDLAGDSIFSELDGKGNRYYGAFYDTKETNEHQRDGKHEYAISKSPIIADVFINIPKLKTHKKCGITVNLKSLVGINANKNWLPHYIFGSPENGGDQFPLTNRANRIENSIVGKAKQVLLSKNSKIQFVARKLKKIAYHVFGDTEKVIRSGNWHGNDTVWRMSLDLNRILLYANPDGTMRKSGEAKKYFSIVDGINAMEGNGPQAGEKKEIGVLLAGENPVAVDAACAKIMGFDWKKMPLIKRAFENHKYRLIDPGAADIECRSNVPAWNKELEEIAYDDVFHFKPHFGWLNRIEMDKR